MLYFLIWTQIGSFLVLIIVAYLISVVGSSNFTDINSINKIKMLFIYIGTIRELIKGF